jgi:hypothetical protein
MKHLSNYENMLWNNKHPKDEHNPSSLVHWRNDIKWSIEIVEYLNFMLFFFSSHGGQVIICLIIELIGVFIHLFHILYLTIYFKLKLKYLC